MYRGVRLILVIVEPDTLLPTASLDPPLASSDVRLGVASHFPIVWDSIVVRIELER